MGEGKGRPDGMKFDSSGLLFCVGPGGVHIFAPDATCLGVLLIPEHTANFAWGDADLCSLYITASTSVYRVRMNVPGVALF
jgi:gluconolactonase